MTHDLCHIRNARIIEFERAHPEMTLEAIGLVFGLKNKASVSTIIHNAGYFRKQGCGSQAFDRSKLVLCLPKYDRALIWQRIQENPHTSYYKLAKEFGCDSSIFSDVAVKHGIHIGKHTKETGRRIGAAKRIKSAGFLREFFSVPRPLMMNEYAAELGYAHGRSLNGSIHRLGIRRRKI